MAQSGFFTMQKFPNWIAWARNLLAISQNGLTFTKDPFDRERFEEIEKIAKEILSVQTDTPLERLNGMFSGEKGYATPKVDVRGGVFKGDKILLVREISDGLWTLPGGWSDVDDSPSSSVEKEILEESGFITATRKLVAVYDRNKHTHPPMFFHIYKLFFICDIVGGAPRASIETDAVDFYAENELPALSTPRVTEEQIHTLFRHYRMPELAAEFD